MRTVVFDLDGTLADTSGDLIAAANACFRDMGHGDLLDPTEDMLTAFGGGRAMLRLGFSRLDTAWTETDIDAGYPKLLTFYAENIDVFTKLYPGVEKALDALARDEFILSVCTNKPEGLAETLLHRLGIRDRFAAMLGADTLPVRKPDPEHLVQSVLRAGGDPARAILIGDTITDRKTAQNANSPCVLVGFGPEGRGVERMHPEAILEHYDDLPSLAAQFLPH